MSNIIPEKNINFSVYLEGTEELGNAEVTLPKLEPLSSEVKGAGIAGVFDSLVLGHFGSTTLSLSWRNVTASVMKLAAHKTHSLDLYGALQDYDAGSGEHRVRQMHLFVKATPKGPDLGKLNVGELGDTQMEFEVLYLKLSIDGEEHVELDKLNYIYRVDGVDYLAGVRSALGKG
jgi:hypothetical protein